tara:strand:- start:578 stop:781 length:204 start_codon:yes stop_codon:yes gene_type:complete
MNNDYMKQFEAFAALQSELVNLCSDLTKKTDPDDIGKDLINLQTKMINAIVNNMTETVKTFRSKLVE